MNKNKYDLKFKYFEFKYRQKLFRLKKCPQGVLQAQ